MTEQIESTETATQAIKVAPLEMEPFKKPVHKSIKGEKSKTSFKGASVCDECGKPSLMRMPDGNRCLNCGKLE